MPRPIRVCSVLGCERTHYAHGYCRSHYNKQQAKKARTVTYSARSQALSPTPLVRTPLVPRASRKAGTSARPWPVAHQGQTGWDGADPPPPPGASLGLA